MNVAKYVAYATLTALALLMALVSYWLWYPYEVITFASVIVPTSKTAYVAGERVSYFVDYNKKLPLAGNLSRALVDGTRTNYPTISTFLTPGKKQVWVSDLTIPAYSPAGVYHIEVSAEYDVNPLRTISVQFRTVDFAVLEAQPETREERTNKNEQTLKRLESLQGSRK